MGLDAGFLGRMGRASIAFERTRNATKLPCPPLFGGRPFRLSFWEKAIDAFSDPAGL
jgi:hypothetical protein